MQQENTKIELDSEKERLIFQALRLIQKAFCYDGSKGFNIEFTITDDDYNNKTTLIILQPERDHLPAISQAS